MKAFPTDNNIPEVKVAVADYGHTGSHALDLIKKTAIVFVLAYVGYLGYTMALPFFATVSQDTKQAKAEVEQLNKLLEGDIQRLEEKRQALDEVLKLSTADTIHAVVRHEKEALLGYRLSAVKDVSTLAVAPFPHAKLTEAPAYKQKGKQLLGIH